MKLPKTGPGRQDVHGELLVRILGPAIRGPAHANDLGIPVSLEPLRTTGQPSNDQQSTTIYQRTYDTKISNFTFFFFSLFSFFLFFFFFFPTCRK